MQWMFQDHQANRPDHIEYEMLLHIRDVVQPPVFVTAALKRKYKKQLALTWSRGGPSLPPV